jgi:cbb3-type cytochrome oxidase maturation protein
MIQVRAKNDLDGNIGPGLKSLLTLIFIICHLFEESPNCDRFQSYLGTNPSMKIMLFLILVSLLLAAGFLIAYLRAAGSGQFDDEYTPAIRMLFDDGTQKSGAQDAKNTSTEKQQDEDLMPSL